MKLNFNLRWISIFQLCVLTMGLTYAMFAQPVHPQSRYPQQSSPVSTMDSIDAVQDERILELRSTMAFNTKRLDDMVIMMNDLKVAVNSATGAVIGFGAALTLLQALHAIAAWKSRGKSNGA